MARMRDRSTEKAFMVYKVSDWQLYHHNDPNAEIIETGLGYWEARILCKRLGKESGEPTHLNRHKVCHEDDWNQQIRLT